MNETPLPGLIIKDSAEEVWVPLAPTPEASNWRRPHHQCRRSIDGGQHQISIAIMGRGDLSVCAMNKYEWRISSIIS